MMLSVSKKNKRSHTVIKSDGVTIRLAPKSDHLLKKMVDVLKGMTAPSKTIDMQSFEGVNMTKFELVFNALQSSRSGLTLSQLASKAKTTPATVSARIAEMRGMGYSVINNLNNKRNGSMTYTLTSPSRSKSVAKTYMRSGATAFRTA